MQGFTSEMFGELDIAHLEEMHADRMGDTVERLEELTVVKRFVGTGWSLGIIALVLEEFPLIYSHDLVTARLMQGRGGASDSASTYSASSIGRSGSTSSYVRAAPPPVRAKPGEYAAAESAPPPYAGGALAASGSISGKRAPPPPPASKPRPAPAAPTVVYVTALYDYTAQADGDLSFSTGDRIELVKKTDSAEDWWTGKLHGSEGVFPGNYVQL